MHKFHSLDWYIERTEDYGNDSYNQMNGKQCQKCLNKSNISINIIVYS